MCRAQVDDAARALLRHQVSPHLLAHEEGAGNVDINDVLPFAARSIDGLGARGDAGVVHQHIEFTEFADDLGHRVLDV